MSRTPSPRRLLILATIDDAVSRFAYYDRKEDEDLPRGEVEAALIAGEITIEDIVERFAVAIRRDLGPS